MLLLELGKVTLLSEQIKKFAFDVGWVLLSSAVTFFLGFLLSILLARWLGAANLGLYRMVTTIQGITALVATLGISAALVKYAAECKDDRDKLSQLIASGLISSVTFGIVAGILLYALSGMLATVFHMPDLSHLLRILAFALPFTSLFQALTGLLNGLREIKTFASLMILQSLLMISLTVIFVIGFGFGVEGAVFGIVLAMVGAFIVGWHLSRKFLRLDLRNFTYNAKKLLSFGGRVFGGNTVALLSSQADIILTGYFLAAKDVGYYSVAVGLGALFLLIPQAIQTITYPATSEYWSKNNHQALQTMIDKSIKYAACILLPIGLGVGFFAREITTTIFGAEFIHAALPLCILIIGWVIRGSMVWPIGASISATGHPEVNLMLNAIAMATSIGLNILFIPRFGILGAAIATTISLLLWTAIFLVLVIRMLHIKIDFKWSSVAIGSAGIAAILFLIGAELLHPYMIGGVILCAYIILIFKLLLTKEDKAILRSLAFSLVSRR